MQALSVPIHSLAPLLSPTYRSIKMKRLNPTTSLPFKFKTIRKDGYLFRQYDKTRKNKDGTFVEIWAHPEYFKEFQQSIKRAGKNWYKENKTHRNNLSNKHYINNKSMYIAKSAKRRAAKLQRTPKWIKDVFIKEINIIYERAKLIKIFTDEEWHVDHIIPLQGKTVSGLHVPWNLQLLPASENLSKGNSYA